MKSDENMVFIRFHQISSELIFPNFHMSMEQNQIEIQIKPKNKDPEPNCIAAFWLSRFVCAAILLFQLWGNQ